MNQFIRDFRGKNGDHKWDVNYFFLHFNPYMVQPIHGHYLYLTISLIFSIFLGDRQKESLTSHGTLEKQENFQRQREKF